MKRLTTAFLTIFFMLGLSATASALSITYGGDVASDNSGLTTSRLDAQVLTFNQDDSDPSIFQSYSGDYQLVSGSLAGNYAAPLNDKTRYMSIPDTFDNNTSMSGSVTFELASEANYFGIYWGSIDTYNSINFFNDNLLVGEVVGGDLGPADGSWTDPDTNQYVNITDIIFDSFVLNTDGIAFEVDNIAVAPVPEPGTIFMMVAGLLGLFGLRRKFMK